MRQQPGRGGKDSTAEGHFREWSHLGKLNGLQRTRPGLLDHRVHPKLDWHSAGCVDVRQLFELTVLIVSMVKRYLPSSSRFLSKIMRSTINGMSRSSRARHGTRASATTGSRDIVSAPRASDRAMPRSASHRALELCTSQPTAMGSPRPRQPERLGGASSSAVEPASLSDAPRSLDK